MKKSFTVLIAALLTLSLLAGCGSAGTASAETEQEPEAEVSGAENTQTVPETGEETETAEPEETGAALGGPLGGWSLPESEEITDERLAVFEAASAGLLGVNYEPIIYLGSQVVSGTNHAFLCSAQVTAPGATTYYAVIYAYEDLQGGVEFLGLQSLTPGGEPDENAAAAAALAGGWSVPASEEEGMAAFDKAVEGLVGVSYTPVRVLGQQVVSGMNYCVLCRAAVVYPDARPTWTLARVYRDLDGECSVSEFADLELAAP